MAIKVNTTEVISNNAAVLNVTTVQAGSTVTAPAFSGPLTGDVTGNVSGNSAYATNAGAATYANHAGNVPGAGVQGTVADATDAAYAGHAGDATTANHAGNVPGAGVQGTVGHATDAASAQSIAARTHYVRLAMTGTTGGGTISYSGGNFKFTTRFICIGLGRGANTATSGYFDIGPMPTTGAITVYNGAAARNFTTNGIAIGSWETLLYKLPLGSSNGSLAANWAISQYNSGSTQFGDDWIPIATVNGDTSDLHVHLGSKIQLAAGESINAAIYDSRKAVFAASATNSTYANHAGDAASATYAGHAGDATNANHAGNVPGAGVQGTVADATDAAYATQAGVTAQANYASYAGVASQASQASQAAYAALAGIASDGEGRFVIPQPNGPSGAGRDHGIYGEYSPQRLAHIWSMGTAYTVPATGGYQTTNPTALSQSGSLYGFNYSYNPDYQQTGNNPVGGPATAPGPAPVKAAIQGSQHHFQWRQNGVVSFAAGSKVYSVGTIQGNISGSAANSTYANHAGDAASATYAGHAGNVPGAGVQGTVADATDAAYAGHAGDATNANHAGNVPGAGVQGTVADATDAAYANHAGNTATIGGATGGTVNSAITAPSFLYASDERLKEDITNIDDPIDNISRLRGVGFKWSGPGSNDYGFIAQEVKKILPEAVIENDENIDGVEQPLTVNLPVIVSHLLEAVKHQQEEIVALKGLVDTLYDQLNVQKP